MSTQAESLCRMCAKSYSLSVSVYVKFENQLTVSDLLKKHLSLKVQDGDGLPVRVCLTCLEQLRSWDRLTVQVSAAQIYLRETFMGQQSHKLPFSQADELQASSSSSDLNPHVAAWDGDETASHATTYDRSSGNHTRSKSKTKRTILSDYLNKNSKTNQRKVNKSHPCVVCCKIFACQSDLARHTRIHTGDRPFHCNLCSLSFNQSSTLQRHLMTHTGEKPFMCQFCSKCFSKKFLLTKHLLTHTNCKPYSCPSCSKLFRDKSNLRSHMASHSSDKPFMCDQCSKCFSLKSALNRHLRSHSSVKPFKCDQCSNNFTTRANLKTHLLIHSGEKKFKCDVCTKSFTYKSSLKKHTISHLKGRLKANHADDERQFDMFPLSDFSI